MAVPLWGGVTLTSTQRKLLKIVEILVGNESGYYITSGKRNTNDYHGQGLAIDIGFGGVNAAGSRRGRDLAKKLYKYSGNTLELIHTTPYSTDNGFYVKHGSRVGWNFYGSATNNAHRDHVHFAANSAQADRILKALGGSSSGSSSSKTMSTEETKRTPWRKRPHLRRGMSGGAVGILQYQLRNRLGYKIDKVKGYPFGPQTEAAVKAFKRKYMGSSSPDGVVRGPMWARLEVESKKVVPPEKRPALGRGKSGTWVGYAQHCLRKAGYKIDDLKGFPFGPQTETAVRDFKGKYEWMSGSERLGRFAWAALDAVEAGKKVKDPRPDPEPEPEPDPEPEVPEDIKDLMKELLAALKEL